MPVALDDAPPAMARAPWMPLLTRIAEETEIGGAIRVAGEPLALPDPDGPAVVDVLADALHARWFSAAAEPHLPARRPRHREGGDACLRLADALRPRFLARDGWSFSYRTRDGVPVFAVTAGDRPGRARASCFLDLAPGMAPEVFGRLVTALDGYGLGFRAQLRGDAALPDRIGSAVVTGARADAPALARVALGLRQRSPFAFGSSVPAFTRMLAPGLAIADEPDDGTDFGRHRCRVIATGLLAAGRSAGPGERRAAVLDALVDAALDPAALHLNPGNPEFGLRR